MKKLAEQWESKHIEQEELREFLPGLCLKISSGPDNPIANYLSMMGLSYTRLFMDVDSSPAEGLNGEAYLYGLRTDSLTLDTIYPGCTAGPEWHKYVERSGERTQTGTGGV